MILPLFICSLIAGCLFGLLVITLFNLFVLSLMFLIACSVGENWF